MRISRGGILRERASRTERERGVGCSYWGGSLSGAEELETYFSDHVASPSGVMKKCNWMPQSNFRSLRLLSL